MDNTGTNRQRESKATVLGKCPLTHRLNNMLSVILGQCELLVDCASDPECRRRAQNIRKAAQRMADEISGYQCGI